MVRKEQVVDLAMDVPASKLPESTITIANGKGPAFTIKAKGLKVKTTAWGTLLFLLGLCSFAAWLGCSIKASQETYAVSQALEVQLPRARPLMLVLLIVLPLTYPVTLCLSLWILRWRQHIKARRDDLGDLGHVRPFLFFGWGVLMLLCVAVLIVVVALSGYALWGGLMYALNTGAAFWLNYAAPSFMGFKSYAQTNDVAVRGLAQLIDGFGHDHSAKMSSEVKRMWDRTVVDGAHNITIVPLSARPHCPVYCFDLSGFYLLNSTTSCICDSGRVHAVITPAYNAWRFVLGAWVALLAMYICSALLALVLGMRHASTGSERKYLRLGGKQPDSPLNAVVQAI